MLPSTRFPRPRWLAALLALAWSSTAFAQTVYFDNLSASNQFDTNVFVYTSDAFPYVVTPFMTDGSARSFKLNSVTFNAFAANTLIDCVIYNDVDGAPHSQLGFVRMTMPGTPADYTFNFSNVTLQPNTEYFVGLYGIGGGSVWEWSTVSSPAIGSWTLPSTTVQASPDDYYWSAGDEAAYPIMQIVATAMVPEPANVALGGALIALGVALARRKSRKPSRDAGVGSASPDRGNRPRRR